jgi:anionic cell wall polymer biosynthesis LytR-Cps2A-Psr (LCP) family protein
MSLPEGESYNRHHMKPVIRRRVKTARTWALRGAMATFAVLVGVGALLVSQGYFNAHKVFKGTASSAASLQKDVDPNLLKGEGDGRINILMSGIGGQGHAGGDLTDTLILASIDPVNNKAALLSVPRDLWVTLPGKGSMKINAAYATAKYNYMAKNKVDGTNAQAIAAGFTSIEIGRASCRERVS